jgi:hypothetical protein
LALANKSLVVAVALGLLVPLAVAAHSQSQKKSTDVTLTGCVSAKPDAAGRYTFEGADGLSRYQLTGRRIARLAGQRVELVGGAPGGGGLAIRGGLVGPQAGARGVALDPSQESVRRQPGGGGAGIGPTYPEFKVSSAKTVAGTCEQAPAPR